jgi:hypothetical protein
MIWRKKLSDDLAVRTVEYDADGKSLVPSARVPLRYSRIKSERRAREVEETDMSKLDSARWLRPSCP